MLTSTTAKVFFCTRSLYYEFPASLCLDVKKPMWNFTDSTSGSKSQLAPNRLQASMLLAWMYLKNMASLWRCCADKDR